MTFFCILIAALSIVTPRDGAVVVTLKDAQKAYFDGKREERFLRMNNPGDRAKLFRVGSTQQPLAMEWRGDTNAVYSLKIVREDGALEAFSITNRTLVYIANLEVGARYHWSVFDGTDTVAGSFSTDGACPRLLRAEGVGNFRDLGGWNAATGRRVRQNRIFRSAGLRSSSKNQGGFLRRKVVLGKRRIKDAGILTLRDEFGIRTDLELRTPDETAGMGTTVLGSGVRWVNVSFAAYGFIDNMVRGREPFAKIFREFTREENYPILMHCSGGRDRTGTLCFLLNGLLGVGEDDLCRDWEASIFSDQGAGFTSDRIVGLLDYLKTFPGDTVNDRIVAYAKSCGITDAEIAKFRELMLE